MVHFFRLVAVALVAPVLTAAAIATQAAVSLTGLKTTAESSDFKSTSSYDDVVKFMKTVDAASPLVFYTTYGKTFEGREMPAAIVASGLKDPTAASFKASGRLRVHIQGNIHAGEVEGKESALMLLREFALGQHADWLRTMVFIVTPIFNADGNEKMSPTNRGRQNGPINGMGTRHQAQNLNINRDFMKLETPEAKAFVKLWNDYDPHVGFDLHTSDGSFHAYHLTYAPPLNPNTSDGIMKLMTDEWFPFVTKNAKAKHGWDTFYYGNVPGPGRGGRGGQPPASANPAGAPAGAPPVAGPRTWASFEHVPRFHNSYVGLRNRFALLSEAYSYLPFEDRIKATRYFVQEALNFAGQNADRIKKACAAADQETIIGKPLATRARLRRGGMIEILMGEVEEEKNPVSGAMMYRRKEVSKPEQMIDMLWFEPSATELAASQYFLPANATAAVELLRAHGIQIRKLTQPVDGLEQFVITNNSTRPVQPGSIDFGQHALRTLEGSWQAAPKLTAPAGAYAVSLAQPLGRLAFYLLEPTSDDGLATWNFLDDLLNDVKTYRIVRKK